MSKAKEDGVITDEEKETIKYSAFQAIACSIASILGIIVGFIYLFL